MVQSLIGEANWYPSKCSHISWNDIKTLKYLREKRRKENVGVMSP